ncbi:Lcl C-terminal domain-containing protein [Nitrospina watsonii]|uniref:Lcl C-terminal domain-containing protein n=1 Tax=Nitrospina watsonii TaxID=1323948 RepID=A0ABN8W6L0_9BACT|nr:DUF1566 domain-containing protein [Nitrospina watsonii]CAI2719276.1 conserved exported protein of unknown function [Nitrospina watsonii]
MFFGKYYRRGKATPFKVSMVAVLLGFALSGAVTGRAFAADPSHYIHDKPFEAPAWIPPPPPPPKTHFIDNGDGTLTDANGLMWTQKDSYAELGRCLNWSDADLYVRNLETGGYTDWRMPNIRELGSIYDNTKENILAWDEDPEHPLHLDKAFSPGAAYWYWSSEKEETQLTDCCARSFYFPQGLVNVRRLSFCKHGGARAVRDPR